MFYLSYFSIGAVVTLWMYREGICEEVEKQSKLSGNNISRDVIVFSTVVAGLFLFPIMLLAYALNGFKWR